MWISKKQYNSELDRITAEYKERIDMLEAIIRSETSLRAQANSERVNLIIILNEIFKMIKSIEIDTFQFGIDYIPDWFMDKVTTNEIILHNTSPDPSSTQNMCACIYKPDGSCIHANYGDFIIKEPNGDICVVDERVTIDKPMIDTMKELSEKKCE